MICTQFYGKIGRVFDEQEGESVRKILLFPILKHRKIRENEFYGLIAPTFCSIPTAMFNKELYVQGTRVFVSGKLVFVSKSKDGDGEQTNEKYKSIQLPVALSVEVFAMHAIVWDKKENSTTKEEKAPEKEEEKLDVDSFISY